ncbi:MAG: DUF1800 domain-containing protein [Cyclobacteriaceae bacterium]|nr:DUF1800 domain-containing protein [Cyclobacteriaceae bacterium]
MDRAAFGVGIATGTHDLPTLLQQAKKIAPLHAVEKPVVDQEQMSAMDEASRKALRKDLFDKSRKRLMNVNTAWMEKMSADPSLRERMTFFWHGHFACRSLVPYFAQQQNNTLRTLALGSFRELLLAISKDGAMLRFLNNQQNKKDHPNENFAREVMELFTLGRGNYSEQDVKEAARVFTGWGADMFGDFQFRPRQHNGGSKTFRGKTKNYTGEEILESILDDKNTARFITTKVARHFVSDRPLPDSTIEDWSKSFYESDYDIEKLMTRVLQSEEFNSPSNIGTKIKSPVELIVGLVIHTGGAFEDTRSMVFLQRGLGQVLFYPPNVSGWPSGKAWIDSSSLTFRVGLGKLLLEGSETDFEASDDGDANGIGKENNGKRKLTLRVNWQALAEHFTTTSAAQSLELIESYLLSRPTTATNRGYVSTFAATAADEKEFIKKAFIGFMSLPEYQLS